MLLTLDVILGIYNGSLLLLFLNEDRHNTNVAAGGY